MTPPTLPARRSVSGADLIVDCDHCQGPHFHGRHNPFSGCTYPHADRCTCPTGTGDGHRRPHCPDRTSPYAARGYVLQEKGALDA